MLSANLIRVLTTGTLWILLLSSGVVLASQEGAPPAATSVTDIEVSFKLDTRTTRSLYMGERWVSPPTYSGAQTGRTFVVEAKAEGVDARGRVTDISPSWIPEDPGMVSVSPVQSHKVEITVKHAGESKLSVESQGFSKKLTINATVQDNVMQVRISQ